MSTSHGYPQATVHPLPASPGQPLVGIAADLQSDFSATHLISVSAPLPSTSALLIYTFRHQVFSRNPPGLGRSAEPLSSARSVGLHSENFD